MTSHEHNPTQDALAPEPSTLGASFLERLKRATETTGSRLFDLYESAGGFTDAVREAVDDVVFGIALEDPEYAENTRRLKEGLSGSEAEELAAKQRRTIDAIRQLVIIEAGIPTDEAASELERAQHAVRERLGDIDLTTLTSDELLRRLGIVEEKADEAAEFTYPRDLFPEATNEKWDMYVAAVQHHLAVLREVQHGFATREEMGHADKMRRFAHNRIASDIDKILGFSELPEGEWDFEKTRRLVAKMREHKFVGRETSESVVTSQALAHGLGRLGLSVLDKLSAKPNQKS